MNNDNPRLAEALRMVIEPHLRPGGPGMLVGVRVGTDMVLRQAYGLAHVELDTPLTLSTRMPIASLSKQMTAMCILLLANEGLLDTDAPLGRYLSDLPESARKPTLRQLMTHQSGLRCYLDHQFLSGFGLRPDGFGIEAIRRMESVNAEPGVSQTYSNIGFHLVSKAAEAVTGKPFAVVMRETLFDRLGLADTELARGAAHLTPGLASCYVPSGDSWANTSHLRCEVLGEGGVVTTLDDLLAWTETLRVEDRRIPPRLWADMKTRASLPNGRRSDYGLGLQINNWRGVDLFGHGGDLIGVKSTMLASPRYGVDVVVLSNTELPTEVIARQLLAEVVGESRLQPARPRAPTADHAGLIDARFDTGAVFLEFIDLDGVLGMKFQGIPIPLEVDPNSGDLGLQGGVGPITITFPKETGSNPKETGSDRLVLSMGGEDHVGTRVAAYTGATPQDLDEVSGDYVSVELDARLDVRVDGDHLRVKAQGPYGRWTGSAQFIAKDVLFVTGEYVAFIMRPTRTQGVVTGLQIDSARTRHLPFQRVPTA